MADLTTPASMAEIITPTDTLSFHAPNDKERIDALKLLADSVAQQRQHQNYGILRHPYTISAIVLLLATILKLNWQSYFGTLLLLCCGGVMACFGMLGKFTLGWLDIAEEVGSGKGLAALKEKEAIVTVWRGEVIGVIAWSEAKKKDDEVVLKVWGFTVRRRERKRGVGGDLVRTMIDEVLRRTTTANIKVERDENNIYTKRPLAAKYNWMLDAAQNSAWKLVQETAEKRLEEIKAKK